MSCEIWWTVEIRSDSISSSVTSWPIGKHSALSDVWSMGGTLLHTLHQNVYPTIGRERLSQYAGVIRFDCCYS
ncbi:hypothetical protein ElyMa_002873000, partial [Elysia marginata]